MNVAVHMFGHLRSFSKCSTALNEKLIKANPSCNFHLFIHTWSAISHEKNECDVKAIRHLVQERYSFFSSIEARIEHQSKISFLKKDKYYGLRCMHYSLSMSVFESSKAGYDLHIVIRPDILLERSLILTKYKDLLSTKVDLLTGLYMHRHLNSVELKDTFGGTDIIFLANESAIRKISEISNQHGLYDVEHGNRMGEPHFMWYLNHKSIEWEYANYIGGKDWRILRQDQSLFSYLRFGYSQVLGLFRYSLQTILTIFRGC